MKKVLLNPMFDAAGGGGGGGGPASAAAATATGGNNFQGSGGDAIPLAAIIGGVAIAIFGFLGLVFLITRDRR